MLGKALMLTIYFNYFPRAVGLHNLPQHLWQLGCQWTLMSCFPRRSFPSSKDIIHSYTYSLCLLLLPQMFLTPYVPLQEHPEHFHSLALPVLSLRIIEITQVGKDL